MQSRNYNIPSNNRELQQYGTNMNASLDYNIPSNNRELQLEFQIPSDPFDYNIPSNNRELQPFTPSIAAAAIITYQVITGNYS